MGLSSPTPGDYHAVGEPVPARRKHWPTVSSSVNKPFSTVLNISFRKPYSFGYAFSVRLRNRRLCDKVFLLGRHNKSGPKGLDTKQPVVIISILAENCYSDPYPCS